MAEFGQKTMFLNVSSVILFALLIGGVMTDWCLQYEEVSEGHYNFSCQNQNDCSEQSYKTNSSCVLVQELYLNSSCNNNGTFLNASVINQLCSEENFTISCINFTVIEKTDICQPCHNSCSSCSGPGEKNCTECKTGFHRSFSPVTTTAISTSTTSTTLSSTIVTDVTDAYDNVTMHSSRGSRSKRGITDSYNDTTNTTPMTTSSTTEQTTAAMTTGVTTIRQCLPCQDTFDQDISVDHLVKKCTEWLKSGMPPVEIIHIIKRCSNKNVTIPNANATWCCPPRCKDDCLSDGFCMESTTTPPTQPTFLGKYLYIIIGGGCGAVVLVVLIVVVVVVCVRRKRRRKNHAPPPLPGLEELTQGRNNDIKEEEMEGAVGPLCPGIQSQDILRKHEMITRYTPDPLRKFPGETKDNQTANEEEDELPTYGNVDETEDLPTYDNEAFVRSTVHLRGKKDPLNEQQELPIYGNVEDEQQDLPINGNVDDGQQDLPVIGIEMSELNDLPTYGNMESSGEELPVYGNEEFQDGVNIRSTVGGAVQKHDRPPTYINLDKKQQEEFQRIFGVGNAENTQPEEESELQTFSDNKGDEVPTEATMRDPHGGTRSMISDLSEAFKRFKMSQHNSKSASRKQLIDLEEEDTKTNENSSDSSLLPEESYENLSGEAMRTGHTAVQEEDEIYENFQVSRRH